VTRATMEAALAARRTPLDRARLLRSVRPTVPTPSSPTPSVTFAARSLDAPAGEPSGPDLGTGSGDPGVGTAAERVALPDVAGLPLRVAARRLHALGLRVEERGYGEIVGTSPHAGTYVAPGDTVRLRIRGRSDG